MIVTLTTDFGTRDGYVAEMKGAILRVAPSAVLVDVTHAIAQGDTRHAQAVLLRTWRSFPAKTVHVVVVDPGVGTDRAPLAAAQQGQWFVGPDNGVLTGVLEGAEIVRLPVHRDASATFHGRDVFAPAAAHLAAGLPFSTLGEPVTRFVRSPLPVPRAPGHGEVLYVDGFGNLVTNLTTVGKTALLGDRTVPFGRTFADVQPGAAVAYPGSGGWIEIAVRDGSAHRVLGLAPGAEVSVTP